MRVRVTAEDIARGVPHSAFVCPISLALEKATGQLWAVGPAQAYNMYHVRLSRRAQRWERRYDAGKPVEPFTFLFHPEVQA